MRFATIIRVKQSECSHRESKDDLKQRRHIKQSQTNVPWKPPGFIIVGLFSLYPSISLSYKQNQNTITLRGKNPWLETGKAFHLKTIQQILGSRGGKKKGNPRKWNRNCYYNFRLQRESKTQNPKRSDITHFTKKIRGKWKQIATEANKNPTSEKSSILKRTR